MKEYLRSFVYDCFKFPDHINWKGLLNVVYIPYSEFKWVNFQRQVLEHKLNVSEKKDCEGYEFEEVVGKSLYIPSLYIYEVFWCVD